MMKIIPARFFLLDDIDPRMTFAMFRQIVARIRTIGSAIISAVSGIIRRTADWPEAIAPSVHWIGRATERVL